MTLKELKQGIKGVFIQPVRHYYFGELSYGTPYFWPINVNPNVISVRKLKLKTEEELSRYYKQYPYLKGRDESKYVNLPMVRRAKDWIFKLFSNYYWIQIGWPIYIYWHGLGWKDKFESPRFEWPPAFYIFFFKWQFVIHWTAPDGDNDRYYEMILWYLKYCNKDIEETRRNWGWKDVNTGESTWGGEYIIKRKDEIQ